MILSSRTIATQPFKVELQALIPDSGSGTLGFRLLVTGADKLRPDQQTQIPVTPEQVRALLAVLATDPVAAAGASVTSA